MKPTETSSPERPDALRRKLFRGAYGGVGVMLAVQAKTALGGVVCQSPSAQMSGNTSPRPGQTVVCSGGRSPGYWKVPQHFGEWKDATPAKVTGLAVCSTGLGNAKLTDITDQGTLLTAIGFSGAPADVGLWAVLAFPSKFDGGQLRRHLGAAWLNAGLFIEDTAMYPLARSQIIDMWNATKSGGTYCPTGMTCSQSQRWTADQVIAYIESLYNINAEIEPELCVPTT